MSNEVIAEKFYTGPLTGTVRLVLHEKKFPIRNPDRWDQFLKDTQKDGRLLATLDYPALSIELEMWTDEGYDEYTKASAKDNGICLGYVVCYRFDEDNWEAHSELIEKCSIKFESPTWEQDLRLEMDSILRSYAKDHGLSLEDYKANANAPYPRE